MTSTDVNASKEKKPSAELNSKELQSAARIRDRVEADLKWKFEAVLACLSLTVVGAAGFAY